MAGGDDRLRDLIFRKVDVPTYMRLPDSRAGAMSCLTGIAARKSVEQKPTGQDRRSNSPVNGDRWEISSSLIVVLLGNEENMSNALRLEKYSFGVGDRFAHQAKAQLRACMQAAAQGVEVTPVWNKSHREHVIVGSTPPSARTAAEAAVRELDWTKPFHVDADHIRLDTVDPFIDNSDFYTLDVADAIGQPAATEAVQSFCRAPS